MMIKKLKLLKYYSKILALVCTFTAICLILHIFICLDISSLKISIHSITRNYFILELLYPIIYLLLGISVYMYSTTLDSSRNILIVIMFYLLILLLVILSSILFLRFANFIFAFWLCVFAIALDCILAFLLIKNIVCNFHLSLLIYLSLILFYFYYSLL